MTKIIQQMARLHGCFDEPNHHALDGQSPKRLLTDLQHLAIKIGGSGKFLIGIGNFFPIQASSTPLDLPPRFAAAGADANGTH